MSGELVAWMVEIFYSGSWHDITADVLNRDPAVITRGVANELGAASPGTLSLTLNNGLSKVNTAVTNRYSQRNPASDLYGLIGPNTPIRVSAGLAGDTPTVRTVQEVTSWPPRSDASGSDLWVPLEAAGILRRLGIQGSPVADTITRLAQQNGPTAYWPLDDPEGSRSARGLYGGRSLRTASTVAAPSYGAGRLAPWLPAGARTNGPTGSTGLVTASVVGATAGGWVLDFAYRAADPATWDGNTPHLFRSTVTTEDQSWSVSIDAVGILATILGIDTDTAAVGSLLDGQVHHVRLSAVEAAGNDATLTVDVDGVQVISLTADIGMATIPAANLVSITSVAFSAALVPVDYGQFILWNTAPSLADAYAAYSGHAGEAAGRRAERLCDDKDVAFASTGDLDGTALMGPQYPGEFLAVLGECAKVEAAGSRAPILVEQRAAAGLHFHTLASLYLPRAADLTLDFEEGQLSPPLDPTPDDFGLVNDATAQRRDGGEAQVEVADGPRGITRAGRYDRAERFDAASDLQLDDIAGWWAHHGTWDEDRHPALRVNLRGLSTRTDGAALVAAAQTLDPRALVVVQNVPLWVASEDICQLVLGITETIRTEEWLLDVHTTAAGPFRVGLYADDAEEPAEDAPMRYGPYDSRVESAFDVGTDTALSVEDQTGGNDLWSQGADFPFLIRVRGVVLRVTAVGAPTGAVQTLTVDQTPVTAGVTGVSIAAGEPVELAVPAERGL
jgi:hypothetical protein